MSPLVFGGFFASAMVAWFLFESPRAAMILTALALGSLLAYLVRTK